MDPAVVGAATTRFGEREDGLLDVLAEAARACLADAGVGRVGGDRRDGAPSAGGAEDGVGASPGDAVDHLVVATASGTYASRQNVAGPLASDLGLAPTPATAVDQTSAGGAAALYRGCQLLAAGRAESVLVVGGEQLTHRSTPDVTDRIAAITHPVERKHGVTLPTFAGLTARRYLDRYDAPREALAAVAVKNHAHGVHNPHAHFQREIDVETVLESPIVADPLRLYDFCPVSDGGAAVLLATPPRARELGRLRGENEPYHPPRVAAVGTGTGTHVVHERAEPTRLRAVERAGDDAFAEADLSADAVDVAELHDMFTILELCQLEALDLADRGAAWRRTVAGETGIDGVLPVNPSGGLKSKGHPLSASGLAQVVELVEQLRGTAGERQVAPADVGLACNVGGFGNCALVTLLTGGER